MTIFYKALPKETVVMIRRAVKGTDSVYEYEMTVDEASKGGYWGSDNGTVGMTAYIVDSKDTLNSYNKNAEISVNLIKGVPCARVGWDFSDGKGDKAMVQGGFWSQDDMPDVD